MTASREPEPLPAQPANDAPTVRLRLVGKLPPSSEIATSVLPAIPVQPSAEPVIPTQPRPTPRPTAVPQALAPAAMPEPVALAPVAPAPVAPEPAAPKAAARPQKSLARRVARKILGPNLLTKRD